MRIHVSCPHESSPVMRAPRCAMESPTYVTAINQNRMFRFQSCGQDTDMVPRRLAIYTFNRLCIS